MDAKSVISNILLFPFSLLYGIVIVVRNWLFNVGILPSKKFDVPVICVGNITVGGTGKTPFTEYLVRLLRSKYKVGVLSRGYKRKSRGYVLASKDSSPSEIGDEPCQIKNKFPEAVVAVDVDRRKGIRNMLKEESKPDVIILDDAFQHRYVNPDVSILLIDYNRPVTTDHLLPMGRLREPVRAKDRAHIVVVTKCPSDIKPIDLRIISKRLKLFPYQTLYFTTLAYGDLAPLFPKKTQQIAKSHFEEKKYTILSLSGIASPEPFEQYLKEEYTTDLVSLRFPDHHNFSQKDLDGIGKKFNAIENPNKIIITTEKDAVRLKSHPDFPKLLKNNIYYIPLTISFLSDQEKSFNKQIQDYVRRSKQSTRLF